MIGEGENREDVWKTLLVLSLLILMILVVVAG
jgi:hypothetical protein